MESPIMADESSKTPAPPYSPSSGDTIHSRIERATDLKLPITRAPPPALRMGSLLDLPEIHQYARTDPVEWQSVSLRCDIVLDFFAAINAGKVDAVADFITRGFVTPDVLSRHGETPLLAAVAAGSLPTVRRLIALGATVNAFGIPAKFVKDPGHKEPYAGRTPLQLAAMNGNLVIVRVLMEDYGADDSLVASDGALALRLAAENGHHDVVAYLPARRGGAWLRWQKAHQRETEIIRRAMNRIYEFIKLFVWRMPRYFIYTLPNEVVWKKRHNIAAWCKRLPSRIKDGIVKMPEHIKDAAKNTVKSIKKLPSLAKNVLLAILRAIKAVPGVVKLILVWVGHGLKTVGMSMLDATAKLLSLIHTTLAAVASFCSSITLKDACNGLCTLAKAILVEMPKAIWSFLRTFGSMTYEVLGDLFGVFGKGLWLLFAVIITLINYIPKKVAKVVAALGRLCRKGLSEIFIYCNPKRV